MEAELNSGDTAWLLTSASMVLLMTPGLAMFYGGMVRAKSVLNMMMMSFGALGLISVLWVLYGYSIAFGNDVGGGLLGDPFEYFGLNGLMGDDPSVTYPNMMFVGFQAVFAIITVALISGAIADRAKFGAWMVFAGVWATLCYFPVAHWVFAFTSDDGSYVGGWIANQLEALDFAGGTAVHINAGAAALALALVLGKRKGFGREPMRPHNLPLVMLGAGLLWFGWFGFNAGSAVAADNVAAIAWTNTLVATGAAILGWLLTERFRDGHPTSLGAASGAVAGLVAITPAANAVNPVGAILLGAVAGVLAALAVGLKYKLGYDDSLDVVGVHLVAGLWGTIGIGLVGSASAPTGEAGLLWGGGAGLLGRQTIGAVAVMVFSFVMAWIIGTIIQKTMGFRLDEEDEVAGIDQVEHAETGYDFSALGGGGGSRLGSHAPTTRPGAHSTGTSEVSA
ncbi:ammonium transporter [Kineococcus sp. SYSU DK004]|uniref:ammonium transporter n=1 Tax=Kineococcus sp. SYSU DK004 TaxID=3383125 RepID=UPI003D7EF23C